MLREDGAALTIGSSRRHGRRLLVRFDGITDRTAAERLRGAVLVVPESWLPELPEGEWWAHQVEGCEVRPCPVASSARSARSCPTRPTTSGWRSMRTVERPSCRRSPISSIDVDGGARIVVEDVPGPRPGAGRLEVGDLRQAETFRNTYRWPSRSTNSALPLREDPGHVLAAPAAQAREVGA